MILLEDGLRTKRQQMDQALGELFTDSEIPEVLAQALRRSLFPGGKRLRPVCVLATAELLRKDPAQVVGLACAVELVHSASLALDDLPSMDDASVRRGEPALHARFGEATANLAAIALLARAFELVAETGRRLRLPRRTTAELVAELAQAVGARGMAAGQYVDLTAETGPGVRLAPLTPPSGGSKDEDLKTIEFIHSRKTGRLFVAAFRLSALALGADELALESLAGFGRNLGLAFQVTDDILSVTTTSEQLGKKSGRDERGVNFATLFGVDAARALAEELVTTATECLAIFGDRPDFLRALARFVVERRH
ncbi:MAG: polyprenyl synthetase family protein [Planctomycetes bacterium]|nr:polyprenyl synthetase family protein [Planctomycetota bacterium]